MESKLLSVMTMMLLVGVLSFGWGMKFKTPPVDPKNTFSLQLLPCPTDAKRCHFKGQFTQIDYDNGRFDFTTQEGTTFTFPMGVPVDQNGTQERATVLC